MDSSLKSAAQNNLSLQALDELKRRQDIHYTKLKKVQSVVELRDVP